MNFSIPLQSLNTLPVKKSGDQYVVYGSKGNVDDLTFKCLFDKLGKFQSVEATHP